jgi:hypothetical protein
MNYCRVMVKELHLDPEISGSGLICCYFIHGAVYGFVMSYGIEI